MSTNIYPAVQWHISVPADESISMSLSRLSYSPISMTFCCMSLVAPPTLPTVRNK